MWIDRVFAKPIVRNPLHMKLSFYKILDTKLVLHKTIKGSLAVPRRRSFLSSVKHVFLVCSFFLAFSFLPFLFCWYGTSAEPKLWLMHFDWWHILIGWKVYRKSISMCWFWIRNSFLVPSNRNEDISETSEKIPPTPIIYC